MNKVNKALKNVIEDDYPQFRSFPLYAMLICGFLVFIAGTIITIKGGWLSGSSFQGRYGSGGGDSVTLFGPGIILIGLGICCFPVVQLIKNRKYKQ
jgi:hypothetical protein